MSAWAAEEYTGNGPGDGAASLGFTGYDPSRPRAAESNDRMTKAATAEVEFLAPKQSPAGFDPRNRVFADPTAAGF